MAKDNDRWDGEEWTREDTARLKREFREEALRLRDEFAVEWQRQMASQMAEFREQGLGGRGRGGRGGRTRPGREPLSRDRIVDSAMKIMDKDGLDKVTMRKVAWDLDTGPASIYVHVRSMTELHGLMLDRLLEDLPLDTGDGDWQDRVYEVLAGYVTLLTDHADFARSALTSRPSGVHYLGLVERLLALMDEGGVPPGQAAWGVDLLLLWATAGAAEHADGHEAPVTEWDALRTALANAEAFPHIKAMGLDLIAGDGGERSQWATRALLNGIASTPRP